MSDTLESLRRKIGGAGDLKSVVRSMKALRFLREQGFKYVKSVKGGINAWSDEIDHSVPKY